MKFVSLAALALALPAFAQVTTTLTYDNTYDNANLSLSNVACSNGANGLLTKGYTTLGSIPTFPYLGGAYTVTGWNSSACGTCYNITYGSTTISALAVDYAHDGFNLAEEAMIALAGDLGVALGKVSVTAIQVPVSACGITA